jgi:hypothetical protein
MAKRVLYDVRWVESDGQNGYFARLTKAEADKVWDYMEKFEKAGHIEELWVSKIEGHSYKALMDELKARAEEIWE